jgi:hypothetical protein
VARRPVVPPALTRRPFTLEEALEAGVSRRQLQGSSWRRVGARTYAWVGLEDGPWLRLAAAGLRLPSPAAFSGLTAAWIHGLDVADGSEPIEVTLGRQSGASGRVGILIRRAELGVGDVVETGGLRTTSVQRTLFDLGQRLSLTEAVVAMDSALRCGLVTLEEMAAWSLARRGRKGVKRLRRLIALADPESESPMETRLRLVIVLAGLPRPESQAALEDDQGRFLGRVDLFYPHKRLAIEYDGATHRDTITEDNRRQNGLLSAGFKLLRFSSPDVLKKPEFVVTSVRTALASVS